MKHLLQILLLLDFIALIYGFYIKSDDAVNGEFFIGISLLFGFFIIMPLFIYHRWKDKNVKDYMLSKENIEKMRAYNDSKDPEK